MGSIKVTQRKAQGSKELALCSVAVLLLVLLSVFVNIHSTHACRSLYAKLQELESSQWYFQEDYGRLLLEQSAWASHYRVERVARSDLAMQAPDLSRYRVVSK